jgi:hypothetical protein
MELKPLKVTTVGPENKPIDLAQFWAWIKALEGNEFTQCTRKLQDSSGYCCLGVAKKLLVPRYLHNVDEKGFLLGGTLGQNDPVWLKALQDSKVANFKIKENLKSTDHTVIGLNDDGKFSFAEIAKILRMKFVLGVAQETIDIVAQHIYDAKQQKT